MAVVHKGESKLHNGGILYSSWGAVCLIGSFFLIMMGDILCLLGVIGLFVGCPYFFKRGNILWHGYKGEQKVLQKFEKLSDEYHLFVGVRVHERMESDLVVVGPSGVFLIEVKNYVGVIEGTASDRYWTLHKTGRKGGRYSRKLDNPIRQQKRNTFIVSQYLRQEGCPVFVWGCTVFPNEDTSWRSGIPERCYLLTENLAESLSKHGKRENLSGKTIQKAIDALDKCVYGKPPMTEEEFEAVVQEQRGNQTKEHND